MGARCAPNRQAHMVGKKTIHKKRGEEKSPGPRFGDRCYFFQERKGCGVYLGPPVVGQRGINVYPREERSFVQGVGENKFKGETVGR